MDSDIERLRKGLKSRGLEIIELQNKLAEQGSFYEEELQRTEKELERLKRREREGFWGKLCYRKQKKIEELKEIMTDRTNDIIHLDKEIERLNQVLIESENYKKIYYDLRHKYNALVEKYGE